MSDGSLERYSLCGGKKKKGGTIVTTKAHSCLPNRDEREVASFWKHADL
jgi:hypothetical protein